MKRLIACALALGLIGCAARSGSGVRVGSPADVGHGLSNASEATVPAGGTIVFQGDDLLYGTKPISRRAKVGPPASRSKAAIPDQLFRLLGHRVTIQIDAVPGDTIRAGRERWKGRPIGDLLVLSYSYGDAAAGTPQADYRAALTQTVNAARAAGVPVFLIVPPTSSIPAMNAKLDPYRAVMRELTTRGVALFETSPILDAQQIRPVSPVAQSDAGYQAIAGAILQHIKVAPPRLAQPGG